MSDGNLYSTDILAWSEQQAEVLRGLAARADLPNALDLSHVVEEIEGVGQSEFNTVKSMIRQTLIHAIKCAVDPEAPSLTHWLDEIDTWQGDLADRMTPSMRRKIDLDALWRRAAAQAERSLISQGHANAAAMVRVADLDGPCPVSLDALRGSTTDPKGLVLLIQSP